jgi:hypothetical protein
MIMDPQGGNPMQTVRYARARARCARTQLCRLDRYFLQRAHWTIYPRHAGGVCGTGR